MTSNSLHHKTPILENPSINARLGKRVFLKMECYQPVGSFKIRGIGALCQRAVESGLTHLVSPSGGNAGYAAAYAGRLLGVEVTVVVPEVTPATARARIAAEGARIIVHGQGFDEANERAKQVVAEVNGAYIHAFDDLPIWDGHASLVAEVVTQCSKPEAVVVAVGGGGLMSGLVLGMRRYGWAGVPVIAVETEGAASFAASLAAGRLETLPAITSIANTLGARRVTAKALDLAQVHPIRSVIVSDHSAVKACLAFADDQRVIVEPACGAALSLLYDRADALADFNSVLMIVCGGAGVTMDQLQAWDAALLT